MAGTAAATVRDDLLERRQRLERTVGDVGPGPGADLIRLLSEVDSALERLEHGTDGLCVVCDEQMTEELLRHPMGRYCLCDLSETQQRALQNDLETAWSIQAGLLPSQDLSAGGWQAHYRYLPAGPVSGDVIDVVVSPDESLYFLFGDVAGKGVSAALLMAHVGAHFRSLAARRLPISELLLRVSDELARRTDAARHVTLVAGVAKRDGHLEIANAGHLPPLLVGDGGVVALDATGVPAGLFRGSEYGVQRRALGSGDSLVLYTDGLLEGAAPGDIEYGVDGLTDDLGHWWDLGACALASNAIAAAAAFRGGAPAHDDQTLLVLRRL